MLVKSQVASVKNTHVLWCDVGDSGENECVSQQEIAEGRISSSEGRHAGTNGYTTETSQLWAECNY